jgi:hypothetical protein
MIFNTTFFKMKLNRLLLVLSVAFFFSCGGDDGSSTQNSIRLDGESFKVIAPSIQGISMDGEGHAAISFVNGGASTMRSLQIDVEYSTRANLPGTYAYPDNGEDRLLDEFLTNYTWFEGQDMYDTQLSSGTVTVKHNGSDNYTVTMDLTMEDGSKFTGTYRGEFTTQFSDN